MSFLLRLSEDGLVQLFTNWLDIQSLSILDVAIASRLERQIWLTCLAQMNSPAIDAFPHYPPSIKWLIRRRISISSIQINPNYDLESDQFKGLKASSVRKIDLSGCRLHEGVLTSLNSPLLETVHLEHCNVYDSDMAAFARRCPRLETISLKYCAGIESDTFVILAQNCPKLKSVDWSGCKNVTNMGLAALASGCPLLKNMILRFNRSPPRFSLGILKHRHPEGSAAAIQCLSNLNNQAKLCRQVTDEGLVALVEGCPQLEVVDLSFCSGISGAGILAIGASCPLLKSIIIEGLDLSISTDSAITALANGCHQLASIVLSHTNINSYVLRQEITNVGITALGRCCPMLHTVDLSGCDLVTDIGIKAMAKGCPLLKILYACDMRRLTGVSLVALGRGCPLLEEVAFAWGASIAETDFRFLFSECPNLRIVEHCTVYLQSIADGCPNLQHFQFYNDAQCILIAGGCHNLEFVEIGHPTEVGCPISDVGIEAIARGCPMLTDIRIWDCRNITDEGVTVLAQCCPLLHTIDLSNCKLITDIGLQAIALGCPLLKAIYLCRSPITVNGVNNLVKKCPLLRYLDITGNDFSVSEIKSIPKLHTRKCQITTGDSNGNPYEEPYYYSD